MSASRARSAKIEALVPAIANGVRAAVSTLVPFFLAAALHRTELSWMALGGWLGTLTDPGGLRSTRLKTLGSFAILGALIIPIAERFSAGVLVPTLFVTVVAFIATFARSLGPAGAAVGTMIAITATIGTAKVGATSYLTDSLSFVAGALWATLLSSLVWSVSPHRPVRRAIAAVYDALGAYGLAMIPLAASAEPGDAWAAMTRTHHRVIRDAVEAALAVALAVRARRPGESAVGGDLRELLGIAEEQFPQLIALSAELEATPRGQRPEVVEKRLRELSVICDEIRRQLRTSPPPLDPKTKPTHAEDPPDPRGTLVLSRRLLDDGERALTLASQLGKGGGAHAATVSEGSSLWGDVKDDLRTLRDGVSVESVFFRHAVRVGVAVFVASIVGHLVSVRPHWITITAMAVLQPYPGPTTTRAAERVVGTVFGSAVAAAITMTVHAPLALAALMFPLSIASVATKPRSYRLFTFFFTPVFVLLAEQHPGDWWTAAARAGDAVIGGAIALATALVVMPAWEKAVLPETLAAMIKAVNDYRTKVLAALDARSEAADRDVADARRRVGIAVGEAETSLERWLAEPLRKLEEGQKAMQLITHARRLANACTALYTHASHGIEDAATRQVHLDAIATYAATLERSSLRPPAPSAELDHKSPDVRGASANP